MDKAIKEFEEMRDSAELRALSNTSLDRELSDEEFERMKYLYNKIWG